MEVEAPDASFDALAVCGSFPSLGTKLGSAIAKICSGELGRKIRHADDMEARKMRMMKGRQALWIIYDHFRINEEAGSPYNTQDLISVKLGNDSNLEAFLLNWEQVINGLRKPPGEDLLEPLFLEQIKSSPALKADIEVYRRARAGEKERSYTFLMQAVQRHLLLKRQEENRKAQQKLLSGGGKNPAAPAKHDQKESDRKICFEYRDKGSCSHGDSCRFSHGPAADKKKGGKSSKKGSPKGEGEGKPARS